VNKDNEQVLISTEPVIASSGASQLTAMLVVVMIIVAVI
jgi:hypothetical protein